MFLVRAGGLRWLGGYWIFILQFNISYVLTASAKHNERDGANDSDGQESADSQNGDHIGRQSCSLILACSSLWFYKSNEKSCQKIVNISLWLHRWYIFSYQKAERHKERKLNSGIPFSLSPFPSPLSPCLLSVGKTLVKLALRSLGWEYSCVSRIHRSKLLYSKFFDVDCTTHVQELVFVQNVEHMQPRARLSLS